MMNKNAFLAKIQPVPGVPYTFVVTPIDTSLGIWGGPILPGDPSWGPLPPVDPDRPHPSHPIALPGDPWWGTFPPKPDEPPKGTIAVVAPVPAGATPPATAPADAKVMVMKLSQTGGPSYIWVGPNVEPV